MKRLFVVACIASLAACGADSDKREVESRYQQEWQQLKASLVYTYPAKQQIEVPTHSPVVLHFSSDITESDASIEADLAVTAEGNPVPYTITKPSNRTLMIEVEGGLDPRTAYEVSIPEIDLAIGTTKASTLAFETKGLVEGPRSAVAGDTFKVVRAIPDGNNFPVVDFATFRVQFSDVLDTRSVEYGNTVSLTDGSGNVVDAHVLVKGHYLTIDPKADLTPGASYTLSITDGVRNKAGDQVAARNYAFTALNTAPRERLVQEVPAGGMTSPLTGRPINMIPMASVLLGEDTETQSSGNLLVELAYAVNFPDAMPIRVPRGTLLEAAELVPVLIGGGVDAGFNSGDVRITFISDATGYMIPNPHSTADDAARNIHLFMDVGVSTANPKANGAINQSILHIELVGTAIVENGGLTVNAVGMVEPEVLGSERAKALLSFYMEGKPGEPEPAADTVPPQLVSWTPGENPDDSFGVNDSILFVFNEPVSIDGASIELRENGAPIDAQVSVDGTTLVIKPAQPLKHSRESTDITKQGEVTSYQYSIVLGAGITDLAGNAAAGLSGEYEFELPTLGTLTHFVEEDLMGTPAFDGVVETDRRSPVVLALYPGFPCVFDESSMDLDKGILGHCHSGLKQDYESPDHWIIASGSPDRIVGLDKTVRPADDLIYVPELPANRPIIVRFSKNIDPNSVSLHSTFRVEKVGAPDEPVDGTIQVDGKMITFWPAEPWEEGATYRYVIASNGDSYDPVVDEIVATPAICDGTQSICDTEGLPVQTELKGLRMEMVSNPGVMAVEDTVQPEAGGPDMVQYFVATQASSDVVQVLAAPSLDRNANFFYERNYPDKLGPPTFGVVDYNKRTYAVEESSGEPFEPVPGACTIVGDDVGCPDPYAVLPKPNTSKLVSRQASAASVENAMVMTETESGKSFMAASLMNTGCGYSDFAAMEPMVCPEDKFMALNSALVTEVGPYDAEKDAVPVSIWPGQIMVTSLPIALNSGGTLVFGIESGPQRIRLRYAQEDPACVPALGAPCKRNQPIKAWLRETAGGPILEATVDAYVDALALEDKMDLRPLIVVPWRHELFSVPITLELTGAVEFLDDGRMLVNQMNTNAIAIQGYAFNEDFSGQAPEPWQTNGLINFLIPEQGTYMQYISTPIK